MRWLQLVQAAQQAEPSSAPDRGGVTAFQGLRSTNRRGR